jgi:hypothetical protein
MSSQDPSETLPGPQGAGPSELSKGYEPAEVEAFWSDKWIELDVFAASDALPDPRPRYVLPMPPPNVTGSLHMGHALTCTLEDILTRYHRMAGFCTLWQPGIDHAGIATQTVVERQLKRELARAPRQAFRRGAPDGCALKFHWGPGLSAVWRLSCFPASWPHRLRRLVHWDLKCAD